MPTFPATLTDRYIDAAMRSVPDKQRDDLAAELRASIADDIDARIDAGEPAADAERAVLSELGDPDKLGAGYAERPLWLIGPRYYLQWRRLVTLLLWIVLPCVAFGVSLGLSLSGAPLGSIIGGTVGAFVSTIVHLFFWTALVFVIIERSTPEGTSDPLAPWTLDQLPEPRPRGAGRGDMVASLVWLGVIAGAVVWDHFVGFSPAHPGLSFLSDGLWPFWAMGLFALLAAEAVLAVAVYAARGWTFALAVVNAVINLLMISGTLSLLAQERLLNLDFWTTIIPDADSAATVTMIMVILTGFTVVGACVWDAIDAFLKARHAVRSQGARP